MNTFDEHSARLSALLRAVSDALYALELHVQNLAALTEQAVAIVRRARKRRRRSRRRPTASWKRRRVRRRRARKAKRRAGTARWWWTWKGEK